MKYTLILKTGKVLTFNVKALATVYQQAYGGVLVDEKICDIRVFPNMKQEGSVV
jgi:hypothetical protein